MKAYVLTRIENAEYSMPWAFTRVVYCSTSFEKVIEYAENVLGILIFKPDYLEIDENEDFGYKVEEAVVDTD